MSAMTKPNRIAVVVISACIIMLVGLGMAAFQVMNAKHQSAARVPIGGPFRLTTQDNTMLSDADLKGSPFAVFFGFTHCPEICPTTLYEMSGALQELGDDGKNLKVLFISVDPTRDTPEFLARYLQSFDRRIVGLTGTEAEIAAVGKEYRAYWEKVPTDDGEYTMNHTASIFLMDTHGEFFGTIGYGEEHAVRMDKLRRLLAG